MEGFWRLSNARPVGMAGVLRIPLSEIESYCRIKDFSYEKRQDFLHYVERLDERFMAFVKERQEEEERKTNPSGAPPRKGAKGPPPKRR